jgi:rhodanese-related sulfurtransferase
VDFFNVLTGPSLLELTEAHLPEHRERLYESGSFEDSVNIPLADLRDEISELAFNTKYIICCDTGRRSESAGFLLSHKGFDVYVLEGGIPDAPSEAVPADTPVSSSPVVDVQDAESGSQDAAEKTCAESDAKPDGSAVNDEDLALLRAENEKLLAEIKENRSVEARLTEQLRGELGESSDKLSELYAQTKTDSELLKQLRGELCESGEKLGLLHDQVQSDANEIRLLQDQYAALQEQHADVVSAHKLELEQLEEQLIESSSRVDAAQEECCAPEKATELVSELETDVV